MTERHPGAAKDSFRWYRLATGANWTCFADIRKDFPSIDMVGEVLVFNLCHNDFRLIATIYFPGKTVYVKALLTHKEYTREEWKKWC